MDLGALERASAANSFYEGIDFLRAAAVFLVLWSHGGPLLSDQQRIFLYSGYFRPGFWGVTLFFSISGFLIIGQLLDMATGVRRESLKVFVMRRCLRTMPTYWLATLLVLIVGFSQWPSARDLGINLLFLQGFFSLPSVLPVAWSLVIEVWSYLLYAALAYASRFVGVSDEGGRGLFRWLPSGASLIGFALIILPVVAGVLRYEFAQSGSSVQALKQGVWPQVDALAYGGMLAWFVRSRRDLFARLTSFKILAPACLVVMSLVAATAPGLFSNVRDSLPAKSILWIAFGFYPCVGFLSCLMIVSLWRFRYSSIPVWASRPCRLLSRCSYSVYLLHLCVGSLLGGLGVGLFSFWLYLVLSIVVGSVGWLLLERPFTRLRYLIS